MTEKQFIEQIAPLIVKAAAENGYSICSPAIAQACLESRYGESNLSVKYHNYFGIKAGTIWNGTTVSLPTREEYTKGEITEIFDAFRVYADMEESVRDYYDFLSLPRYQNLKNAKSAIEYTEWIRSDGYATDHSYVEKVMDIVKKHDLERFDRTEEERK